MDTAAIKAMADRNQANAKAKEQGAYDSIQNYDGQLSYGEGEVLIASSQDNLNEYMVAIAQDNKSKMNDMILAGEIAYAENGCKVDIIESDLTMMKVKILTGDYCGIEAWTIIEAVRKR